MNFLYEALVMGLLAAVAPSPHNLSLGVMSLGDLKLARILNFCLGALLLDTLIIVLSFRVNAPNGSIIAPLLRIAGSVFYIYLAYKLLRRTKPDNRSPSKTPRGGLLQGALIQSCNPNPFLFWFLIGGPRALGLFRGESPSNAVVYILAFMGVAYLGKALLVLVLRTLSQSWPSALAYSRFVFGPMMLVLAVNNLVHV
ncbi:MAG: hypothetical protein ABIR96_08750 [Bdellovibrionota bacterium]